MKAARSIASNCLTVVSGRGGTGKTEVVAAVLGAAEELMKDEQGLIFSHFQYTVRIIKAGHQKR